MSDDYREDHIRVLEGLEAVRVRPGMYIGSTGPRGLHHLVWEIVDNAVDEALAGACTKIELRIEQDNVITVTDDGRGIPTGMHETGIPTPTVVMTKLHAGGKFGEGGYRVSGGLHGVGASVVNALSEWLELEVYREGRIHYQRFERGLPVTELEARGGTRRRGTRVRFKPDATIFSSVEFNADTLADRMRELAFLNPELSIRVVDRRRGVRRSAGEDGGEAEALEALEAFEAFDEPAGAEAHAGAAAEGDPDQPGEAEAPDDGNGDRRLDETFSFPGGLSEFVGYLNENYGKLHAPVLFTDSVGDMEVEVALQYNDGYTESLNSFVNCINTVEGGQHETGFRTAHTRIMNEYAKKLGVWKKKGTLSGSDLREGLMAVLHVRMTDAEFEGQTKTKLGNLEARSAVEEVVAQHLAAWLDEHPKEAKMLLEKSVRAASARKAARKARDAARTGRSSKVRTSLDGKLTRCASRKAEENEIFIVEGDSAGGSAKQGRDRMHQAILPLKGKPLNTEKASLAKVLANKEILAIVQAIGAGIGPEFDLSEANYGRVIILADADDDGAHIRCLLLTFFYRFMKQLIKEGRVYIAQPPLFKVERKVRKKLQQKYAWSQGEMEKIVASWGKGANVQRFKGLGEMNPDQLWETTMNPETRTLVRVTIEDGAIAERQVGVLMGNRAEPRKKWIVRNVRFGEDDPVRGTTAVDADVEDEDEAALEEATL